MCHRIEDDYQHLAHDYLNVDDVVIARVDSSKNEIKGIVPPDFPMIVLYKAGGDGESQAVLKADQITYSVMKKFVENNRVVVNLPKKLEAAEPAKEEEGMVKEEEVKEEVKEEPKEEVKEEPKEEVKEEPKEEVKEEPKEEVKEEIREEVKEEVKEEEIKEEVKEEVKEEEPKEEVKEEVDELLEEEEEEPKEDVQDEGMCTSPDDPCSDESGEKEEEEL